MNSITRLRFKKSSMMLLTILTKALFLVGVIHAQEPSLIFRQIAWNPIGTEIAIAGGLTPCNPDVSKANDYAIYIFNASTAEIDQTLLGHRCLPQSVSWKPDGSKLASSDSDGVQIWDITNSQPTLYLFPESGDAIVSVLWSPDGIHIANIVASSTYVPLWDSNTGEVISIVGGPEISFSAAWSPDSSQLAIGTTEGVITIWDSMTGMKIKTLLGHSDTVRSIKWSPDGQKLVGGSIDGTVRIWNTISDETLRIFEGHNQTINVVDWNPSSNHILSGDTNGTILVWDSETGQILDTVSGNGLSVVDAKWSPNGNQIAYLYAYGSFQGSNPVINVFAPNIIPTTPTPIPISYGKIAYSSLVDVSLE